MIPLKGLSGQIARLKSATIAVYNSEKAAETHQILINHKWIGNWDGIRAKCGFNDFVTISKFDVRLHRECNVHRPANT